MGEHTHFTEIDPEDSRIMREILELKRDLASAQREVAELKQSLRNADVVEQVRIDENAALRERLEKLSSAVNARKQMYGDLTEAEEEALRAALTTMAQGEK